MELYNLGKDIVAFTTDRTQGRDMDKIRETIIGHYPVLQGRIKNGLYPHQTHTDNVFHITEEFLALPEEERKASLEGIDAIISNVEDVIFGISTADCIPVIVYDPVHHAAAAIHAGWKGTVKRIVEKSLKKMQETFETNPAECVAAIGPGISLESFEVGDEVGEAFTNVGFDIEEVSSHMPRMNVPQPTDEKRLHLDLKEINRRQLLSLGVTAQNIEVSPIDTYTDERFFSARREQKGNIKCGRILSGFIIRNPQM